MEKTNKTLDTGGLLIEDAEDAEKRKRKAAFL